MLPLKDVHPVYTSRHGLNRRTREAYFHEPITLPDKPTPPPQVLPYTESMILDLVICLAITQLAHCPDPTDPIRAPHRPLSPNTAPTTWEPTVKALALLLAPRLPAHLGRRRPFTQILHRLSTQHPPHREIPYRARVEEIGDGRASCRLR